MSDNLFRCIVSLLDKPTASLIVTGARGAGKTYVCKQVATALRNHGISVGGVLSPRVIDEKRTVGYMISDLISQEERLFAAEKPPGIKTGRFYINEKGITFACTAIERAICSCCVVFVDEIGPLEISGNGLLLAARKLLAKRSERMAVLPVLIIRPSLITTAEKLFPLLSSADRWTAG